MKFKAAIGQEYDLPKLIK